jgi:hypothetical protein
MAAHWPAGPPPGDGVRSALASFAVEQMGIDRLRSLRASEVHDRVRNFRELTAFDHVPMLTADA